MLTSTGTSTSTSNIHLFPVTHTFSTRANFSASSESSITADVPLMTAAPMLSVNAEAGGISDTFSPSLSRSLFLSLFHSLALARNIPGIANATAAAIRAIRTVTRRFDTAS